MRAAIGTQTIFKAILIFTLIFVGFISVAINYNKAYKLKNETITIIEKYEGKSATSIKIINNYIKNNGYTATGKCDNNANEKVYGLANLNSTTLTKIGSNDNKNYYYCLSSEKKDNKVYYNIKMFSKFNMPVLGDLFTFKITGRTKGVKYFSENQLLK